MVFSFTWLYNVWMSCQDCEELGCVSLSEIRLILYGTLARLVESSFIHGLRSTKRSLMSWVIAIPKEERLLFFWYDTDFSTKKKKKKNSKKTQQNSKKSVSYSGHLGPFRVTQPTWQRDYMSLLYTSGSSMVCTFSSQWVFWLSCFLLAHGKRTKKMSNICGQDK